MITHAYTHL